jgi:Domain of unknown function (DUF4111)
VRVRRGRRLPARLGGFRPGDVDVDVLAVVAAPGGVTAQRAMGAALAAAPGCPGTGPELSVVTAATAAALGEVHVNTVGPEPVVVTGADHPADPDLVLHGAVCREHATAVSGPPPDRVFGAVPGHRVVAAMRAELEWALDHPPGDYAVLNACRALRYADDGRLCSKVDGGGWWPARHAKEPTATAGEGVLGRLR